MNMQICESPVRIFDKEQGKFMYVRCGKCNTCRNMKSSTWIQRINQESQCWPYSVFFTLTFDESHVPHLVLSPNNSYLVDPNTGLIVDPSEVNGYSPNLSNVERRLYICRRRFIPYVTPRIAQDFIKRLRYYFTSYLKNYHDSKILRYFLVSEYGPSTYRPHIHGILWFKSEAASKVIHQLILKAWSFGAVDCSFVKSSASSYVARYVNCTSGLPRIYLHKQIRPFMLCSKQPPIGTLLSTTQELSEIFVNGSVQRNIIDYQSLSSKDVPLWRSFESRLFPKIRSFNVLNHRDRVTLYSVFGCSQAECFEDFLTWTYNQIDESSPSYNTFMGQYLSFICNQDSNSVKPDQHYSLKHLYYVSKHVFYQRTVFGCSLDYYVDRIENYYNNKELYKLRNFYQFQADFARDNPCGASPLLFMYENWDCLFKTQVIDNEITNYNCCDSRLSTFGFELFDMDNIYPYYDIYEFRRALDVFSYDVKHMKDFNMKVQRDSMKTKKKNEYLQWIDSNEFYKRNFNFNYFKTYA